jgi:hypothetical protein
MKSNWPIITVISLALAHYAVFWRYVKWDSATGKIFLLALPVLVLGFIVFSLTEFARSRVFAFWRKEPSVKLLFDHFRNIGLCGAVFFAADFLLVSGGFPTSTLSFLPIVAAVALNLVALVGFVVQVLYFQDQVIKSNTGKAHTYIVFVLNFIFVSALLQSVAFKRLPELFK